MALRMLAVAMVSVAALLPHSQAQDCGLPQVRPVTSRQNFKPSRITFPGQHDQNPPSVNLQSQNNIEAPYQGCGAAVINDRFVLTAAYCVLDPNNPVSSVVLGDLDLTSQGEPNSQPAEYELDLIIIHPNFTVNPETQIRYHDLALLRTARTIEFNEAVFPYCLRRSPPSPGTEVIASGFGLVNQTHSAKHLQEGKLNVMSLASCEREYRAKGKEGLLRQAYPDLLQGHGVVCAGHPERGVCRGDEGGPLMRIDSTGRRYLEGILSFAGDVCGPGLLPSISTSIADHIDFIESSIREAPSF